VSYDDSKRESQVSLALDRIERFMEHQQAAATSASSASSAQLHMLIGQDEFLLFSLKF
jgi:hypothetical protein